MFVENPALPEMSSISICITQRILQGQEKKGHRRDRSMNQWFVARIVWNMSNTLEVTSIEGHADEPQNAILKMELAETPQCPCEIHGAFISP